jgi:hypothetical protein
MIFGGRALLDEGRTTSAKRLALGAAIAVVLLGNVVALAALDDGSDAGTPQAQSPSTTTAAAPGGPVPTADGSTGSAPSTPEPQRAVVPTTTTPARAATSEKPSSKPNAVTSPAPVASASTGDYVYEVAISAGCVRAGEAFTVTMRLRPGHLGGLIASYADGSPHETKHTGEGGPDGLLTHTAETPSVPGPATLQTYARDDQGRTGSTKTDFRVAGAGESC